jgi:hypothetical protein
MISLKCLETFGINRTPGGGSCLFLETIPTNQTRQLKEVFMGYVDGFVIPVPEKNLKAYIRMARIGEKVWLENGALDYKECIDEDLESK